MKRRLRRLKHFTGRGNTFARFIQDLSEKSWRRYEMNTREIRKLACDLMGTEYPVPGYKKRLPNGATSVIMEALGEYGYSVSRPTVLRWFAGTGQPRSAAMVVLEKIRKELA